MAAPARTPQQGTVGQVGATPKHVLAKVATKIIPQRGMKGRRGR